MYDLIQATLTATAEATVIVGITGIVVHAILSQHCKFMTEFCPPVAPYTPDTQEAEAISPEIQAEEVVETAEPTQPETTLKEESEAGIPATEINLNNLDAGTLRKLCAKHQIAWRNVRGHNRHATKGMMVCQLQQRLTA